MASAILEKYPHLRGGLNRYDAQVRMYFTALYLCRPVAKEAYRENVHYSGSSFFLGGGVE